MNKTELGFNLILCNVFIFCSYLRSIKNRNKGKNGRESNDEIKEKILKSLINSEIEFKFG